MILAVHQPQYIPWLGYFDKIAKSDRFVFLDQVQYKEREFQNRNKIRTKDGWMWLTVPVASRHGGRQKICDVLIDNSAGWQRQHLESLRSWYGRAPFLNEHLPFFEDAYKRQWEQLTDLSTHIIKYLLEKFSISTPLAFEAELDIRSAKTDRIIEICQKMKADTYLSGAGGRDYLEEEKFGRAGIKLVYQEYRHPAYRQQFMSGEGDFLPFMSAIDLLFNEGPGARDILGLR